MGTADTRVALWQSTHHHGRLNLLQRAGRGYSAWGLVMIAAVPETDTRKDEWGIGGPHLWPAVIQQHCPALPQPRATIRDSLAGARPQPFQFDGCFPEYNSPSLDGFHAASIPWTEKRGETGRKGVKGGRGLGAKGTSDQVIYILS